LLVDETSRGQLRHKATPKVLLEAALVVIKALDRLIVDTSDINDNVAGVEDSRVTRTLEV
jgi:hypothetical protein